MTVKQFKTLDLCISITLIAGLGVYCMVRRDAIIPACCITGGWQVISMLVHAIKKWFTRRSGNRYTFHCVTCSMALVLPAVPIWMLACSVSLMAIYYSYLCYHEVFVSLRRPMALLK